MNRKQLTFDDFEVGFSWPPHQYRIDSEANDAFLNTFANTPVQNSAGEAALSPAKLPVVRTIHPALAASFQLQHAAFAWPTGVLHAREKSIQQNPIYPGETLEAGVAVKDKYVKNDKQFIVLEITVKKQETDRLALTVERTLVWPKTEVSS